MMKATAIALALMMSLAALSGCATNRAERGAVIGGAGGAAVGALATGTLGGAAIGGVAGAAAGYVIGKHSYSCWRTNIFGNRYKGTCLR